MEASASTNDDILHWTPDMQVVIGDDNQIKIEPMTVVEKRRLEEAVRASAAAEASNSSPQPPKLSTPLPLPSPTPPPEEISGNLLNHNFDGTGSYSDDLDELQHQNFESKRLNATSASQNTNPKNTTNLTKIPSSSWRPVFSAHQSSPEHRRKTAASSGFIPPSSSKIPDYVTEQLLESNRQTVHADDAIDSLSHPNHVLHKYNHHTYHHPPLYHKPTLSKSNPSLSSSSYLEVPIGSRLHTVRFQSIDDDKGSIADGSDEPTSSSSSSGNGIVGTFNQYEGNHIIELPSSKPVLPIVFNFRTSSSPIVTTQTHYQGGSQPASPLSPALSALTMAAPSSPKTVQYFRTIEPPQIKPPQQHYTRVIQKPIVQKQYGKTPTTTNSKGIGGISSSHFSLPYHQMYHYQAQPTPAYNYGGQPRYVEKSVLAPVYKQQQQQLPANIHFPNLYTMSDGIGVDYTDDFHNGPIADHSGFGYSHDGLANGGGANGGYYHHHHHQSPPLNEDSFPTYEGEASSPRGYGYSQMMHKNPYMDIAYTIPYRIEDLYKKPVTLEEPQYLGTNKFNNRYL